MDSGTSLVEPLLVPLISRLRRSSKDFSDQLSLAVVDTHERKQGVDFLAGVSDFQRNEGEVAFGAEGDGLRGGRAEGLDVLDGGAEECVLLLDAAGKLSRFLGLVAKVGGDLAACDPIMPGVLFFIWPAISSQVAYFIRLLGFSLRL
jgi:hypothetical protein